MPSYQVFFIYNNLHLNARIHTIASKLIRGMYPNNYKDEVTEVKLRLQLGSSASSNGGPTSRASGVDL